MRRERWNEVRMTCEVITCSVTLFSGYIIRQIWVLCPMSYFVVILSIHRTVSAETLDFSRGRKRLLLTIDLLFLIMYT